MTGDKYIQMYRTMHKSSSVFPGQCVKAYAVAISRLIQRTGATSLLDYGCGKGLQYSQAGIHKQWGILPDLYDPGVDKFSTKPDRTWCGVICVDVMEHIPLDAVPDVLHDIISSATRFVFFNISTRLASAILPNGENAHCTVRAHDWWVDEIRRAKGDADCVILLISKSSKTDAGTRTEL